jgi:CRP/FNR family transcriptional regulator
MHKAPYFQILSDKEIEIINQDRYSVRYKPGETILKQGTSATHVLSLIDGIIKLYIEGVGEKNLLLGLQNPFALIGGPGIHTDRKIHYSVVALTEVSVCFISIEQFNKVMQLNCKFSNQLIHHISIQAVNMFDKVISLTQKQMHGRMADGLLYLSREFYKEDSFTLHLSRQDIADLTAMSKDSAIRILKDFERDGVIRLSSSKLEILDMDQLHDISIHG